MFLFRSPGFHLTMPFLAVAGGLLIRWFENPESDISGNILLAQRVLEGARPHVDLHDVNPPSVFYLYVPAVLIETWFGLRAETAAHLVTMAAVIGIAALGEVILHDGKEASALRMLRLAVFLVVVIFIPMRTFSQRDHIAFLLLWPLLAVFMRRAEGAAVPMTAAFAAGLFTPLGLSIKPYLVLGPAFAIAVLLLRQRHLRALRTPEIAGACASGLAVAAWMIAAHPVYLIETLPTAIEVYGPIRIPNLLTRGILVLAAIGVAILFAGRFRGRWEPPAAAAAGFALAYFLAGKGLAYQAVPALSTGLLVLLLPSEDETSGKMRMFAGACLAAASTNFTSWAANYDRGLEDLMRRTGPPNPAVGHLAIEMSLPHPMIRNVGGRLVGPSLLLWKTWGADYGLARTQDPERIARLEAHRRAERDALAAAWAGQPPDLVLVQVGEDWAAWAAENETLARMLADYEEVGRGLIGILLRPKSQAAFPAPVTP
jgi:hypothetical protein